MLFTTGTSTMDSPLATFSSLRVITLKNIGNDKVIASIARLHWFSEWPVYCSLIPIRPIGCSLIQTYTICRHCKYSKDHLTKSFTVHPRASSYFSLLPVATYSQMKQPNPSVSSWQLSFIVITSSNTPADRLCRILWQVTSFSRRGSLLTVDWMEDSWLLCLSCRMIIQNAQLSRCI